jgi:CubicO group peptidase (beta-lactamase class C family)
LKYGRKINKIRRKSVSGTAPLDNCYGEIVPAGIHLFKLPWIFNPTGAVPYFIGHSGLSGALVYYSPEENIYIAGTVNQLAYNDLSFRTMISLVLQILKRRITCS